MPSLKDYFSSFVDQQNLERLRQCAEIEQALVECEKIHKNLEMLSNDKSGRHDLEIHPKFQLHDSRAGMRIARFYGWGLRNPRAEEAIAAMRGSRSALHSMHNTGASEITRKNDESIKEDSIILNSFGNRDANKSVSASCSKEHHALWGCRAMALGCAKELIQLKKCFSENHIGNDPKYFSYDIKEKISSNDEVCSLNMREVGACVTSKWNELNERMG